MAKKIEKTKAKIEFGQIIIVLPQDVIYASIARGKSTMLVKIPTKTIVCGDKLIMQVNGFDRGTSEFAAAITNLKAICKRNPDDKMDINFAKRLARGRLLNAIYAAVTDLASKQVLRVMDTHESLKTKLYKSSLSLSRVDEWRKAGIKVGVKAKPKTNAKKSTKKTALKK